MRPGEEIELAITAVDPQGKPVVAELSLGMVEQALWNLFGSNVAPIEDVFRGNARQSALKTATTASFAYYPETRTIDRSLLAEEDRQKVAAEEAARKIEYSGQLTLVVSQTQEVHERLSKLSKAPYPVVDLVLPHIDRLSTATVAGEATPKIAIQEEDEGKLLGAFDSQTKALSDRINSVAGEVPKDGAEADFDSLVENITSTIDDTKDGVQGVSEENRTRLQSQLQRQKLARSAGRINVNVTGESWAIPDMRRRSPLGKGPGEVTYGLGLGSEDRSGGGWQYRAWRD